MNSHEITKLSRNPIVTVNSHEITWLTKSIRDGELSRNTTKNCHENTEANLVATLFSWGWPSQTPATKRIRGGELSWKCDFRVSIIVSVDAWQCTLTHYFRESKTTFRDVFSTLTKYLVSGSGWQIPECHLKITFFRLVINLPLGYIEHCVEWLAWLGSNWTMTILVQQ